MRDFMYRTLGLLFIAAALPFASSVAQPLNFSAPYAANENLEPVRSELISYRNAQDAMRGNKSKSENFVSLSGEWRVKYFGSATEVGSADLQQNTSLESWGRSTTLPSSWQMNGQGTALYSQSAYPFLDAAPMLGNFPIPNGGSCALYLRDFSVPFDYTDRKLYVTVGGGGSKVTLYINGKQVGFSTDSRTPAGYDISKYVERGRNRIALLVSEYSGGSWLEDGTGWRLNGINREVYLYAQPKIRIRDVMTTTSLDPTYKNGLLRSALLLKSELLNPHNVTVFYDLYDPSGQIINKGDREVRLDMRKEDTVRFNTTIMDVQKWSADLPQLYTIVYSIKREGRFTEYVSYKVGFRSVEIAQGELRVNGNKTIIKGVNYAEFNATTGNVITPELVQSDMEEMRSIGINAIRVGDYSMPQYFYELADSIGFYVVSGANINTSGLSGNTRKGHSLANNPNWKELFVQRAVAAYEVAKRHPSLLAISLGQNAGNGYNMYEAYLELRRRNPELLITYSDAGSQWNTDIVTPLYPKIEDLQKSRALQPTIPAAVVFDKAYWQLPNSSGAFLDLWQNLSLKNSKANYAKKDDDYKTQSLNNGNVQNANIVTQREEIKKFFERVSLKVVNKKDGIIELTNNMSGVNLSDFAARYRIVNGTRAQKWLPLLLNCADGESTQIELKKTGGNATYELEIGDILKAKF